MSMLDKTIYLYDEKQFTFLQEGSNRTLCKAQILLVLQSHELLSTLHVTSIYIFIYLFHHIEFKFENNSIIQQIHQ